MDDLISEFLTETNESLGALDLDLVNLEQNPNDKELLSNIFRLMHTIKGTCGFLGLPRLEKVAHHAENVLGRFRDGDLDVTPDYVTLIFESLDCIKFIIGGIEESGSEPEGDDSALIEKLDAVYEGRDAGQANGEAKGNAEDQPPAPVDPEQAADADIDFSTDTDMDAEPEIASAPSQPPPAPAKPAAAPPAAQQQQQSSGPVSTAQSLRVNVDVLENLMTMVSELVLTRNQLLQILRAQKESEFTTPLQRLNHVVSELQEGVMKTRMQPIGNAWSKLPRIIRDLSLELGKKINLEMLGQDTELDRQVLDMIKDPLTHMVRNSADHGIEMPEERLAAGKPETGRVTLNAYHEGGHIIIEITDDGKGLSTGKIKDKVLKNGLATAEELEAMSTQQIQQFIFNAGLSTAEKVTAVSGRGVGMDVVRTNIEKIGGSIELKSVEGQGSTFLIKIPLTLAIVSALVVESGGERFAIPQLAVKELVMANDNSETTIETIKGAPFFRLRDQLLPLVVLRDLLGLPPEKEDDMDTGEDSGAMDNAKTEERIAQPQKQKSKRGSSNHYIVVTQIGAYLFGIIVDKVFDTEEIVVKPVASILKRIDIFSGNTILGDGSVIMILDPAGIAKATGKVDSAETMAGDAAKDKKTGRGLEKTALLLFQAGKGAPKAVPLSLISRLEEIKVSDIENSSNRQMIQYRGKLMPLTQFDPAMSMEPSGQKPILVFADEQSSMGLVVDEIIDITEEYVDVQVSGNSKGLIGSAIIEGKATDVVDVGHFLQDSNKNWFKQHGDEPFGDTSTIGRRVLLVDDSPFFRNMIAPLLRVAGYSVTALDSPRAALEMCESGAEFDVIVSDIEMPEMNGFEFAQKVRGDGSQWKNTPMVALSSHATPQDIDRGREVGFSNYIAKFDRDTLLNTLSETLIEYGKAS